MPRSSPGIGVKRQQTLRSRRDRWRARRQDGGEFQSHNAEDCGHQKRRRNTNEGIGRRDANEVCGCQTLGVALQQVGERHRIADHRRRDRREQRNVRDEREAPRGYADDERPPKQGE